MLRTPRSIVLFAVLASAIAVAEEPKLIGPGSAAPPLSMKHWLKGEPVKQLAKDRTYVVEFWATWCAPCIASMPHLSKLAKANADVTFIGVGVWEDWNATKIPKFVAEMGEKMEYRVGYSGNRDGMAATWLWPALQDSIPAAFIVKDQKILWMGHPQLLDEPLAQIKAGTFDAQAFKTQYEAQREKTQKSILDRRAFQGAVGAAEKLRANGKRPEAFRALDAAVAKYPLPKNAKRAEELRLEWLTEDDPKGWEQYVREFATSGNANKLTAVNWFAYNRASLPKQAGIARRAIMISLEATNWSEPNTLSFATAMFKLFKEDAIELKAIDALLKTWPADGWEEEERVKYLKRKAELEKKLKG